MRSEYRSLMDGLKQYPQYQSALFEYGYLLTDRDLEMGEQFPFYGNWEKTVLNGRMNLYLHRSQKAYVYSAGEYTYFLLGHAYDPFANEADEHVILRRFAEKTAGCFTDGFSVLDDLTGLFLLGILDSRGQISFCGDFESMRTTYYGCVNGHVYLSSHEELVAYFEELHFDPYVKKLEDYFWYRLYGEGLPGDISHYLELKKLICNTFVQYRSGEFTIHRMWPREPLNMCAGEEEYRDTVRQIAGAMSNSMDLIARKWARPAVSTTGGRDSKGSLAAAVHAKDRYRFYSYNSQHAEKVDCDAAAAICAALGVEHTTYTIPLERETYPEYDVVKTILMCNSNRRYFNHNDIMKRIFFRTEKPFDVEVKSWTSEIGRAFYYKRYGVRRMQKKCTPRRVNVMNNIYLLNPVLMYRTDARYADYLRRTEYNAHMFNYDWSDIIDLEMRDSRWGADVISCEHMFAHDVTVPYNNRHLGELFLAVPLEDRIRDRTHIDFTAMLCPKLGETEIHVKDVNHDWKRLWMDKIYYFVSSVRLI